MTTNLNTPVTLNAAANDVAGVGGTLNLNSIVPALSASFTVDGEGTFVANNDGTVTFTPVTGFVGVVTVPYTISDALGLTSNPANLTVTVHDTAQSSLPVANNSPFAFRNRLIGNLNSFSINILRNY